MYLPSPYKTLLTACVEQEKNYTAFSNPSTLELRDSLAMETEFLFDFACSCCMHNCLCYSYIFSTLVVSGSSSCSIFKSIFFQCLVDVLLKISLILSVLFTDFQALSLLALTGLLCGVKENTGAISFGVCLVIVINNSCFHYLETDRLICLPTITR